VAYLKLASGCDRRCAFCAIPSFRGSFVSRAADDVLAEGRWLAATGARELVLVSENSTSYGKDLGNPRALEALLPRLAAIDGIERVRVTYLQPAELRPTLIETIATTFGVAPYFDLSFQHASRLVLRRMRRFGAAADFLDLLGHIRELAPRAGARSNVIVGFPGETDADVEELERFLTAAHLDVVGVFGYSDEDGTEAARMPGKIDEQTIAKRVARIQDLADELVTQRAEDRIGEAVRVLVDAVAASGELVGTAAHQAPDVDATTRVVDAPRGVRRGDTVHARVVASEGADLVARACPEDES
jgi:MiaB/RimO family radical SAM methylthiotransferase